MEAFTNVVCALAEPIQGEGGIRELSPLYLAALRAAADEHGFPLVLDEIQCGLGRTGRFLASEGARVRGDYVTLSKALGGGLVKLAALLVERERYVRDFGWLHTSTFADDDHSAAVGLAVLDAIDADDGALLRACHDKGAHLAARLRELAARFPDELVAVRGRGLMLGIELGELPRSGSPLLRLLGAQRLLAFLASGWFLREARIRVAPTLSAHATIRLEPSAGVPVEELDRFVDALGRLLAILRQGRVDALLGAPPPPEGPRLTVVPPPPAPAPGATSERVGFLAHFLEPGDLRAWEPRLGGWSDDAIEAFLDDTLGLIEPFHLKDVRVRSATGATVDAAIVAVPFLPAQVMRAMKTGDETPLDLVRAGVALLRAHGARVVGFGGYTSIASDNCTAIATADVALTSGNSLTAAAALEALFAEAARAGIDAARARLGVVGAAGNIGAVLAEVASDRVGELVLVGRAATVPRLEEAAEALREAAAARGRALTVRVAGDLAALQGCALVVSATNAPRPVVKPEHIGDGPVIVADVAAPRDVDPTVAEARPRARVLRGGMVRLPDGQTLDLGGLPLQPGQIYGCLAETLLLGLDGAREHFSYGALRADRVRAIAELARRHGFALS
jgi:predicted amino acid dehydrogenase